MEEKLFSWKDSDFLDELVIAYYHVTLIQAIGAHQVGDTFKQVVVNFESGVLSLESPEQGIREEFDITLTLTPKEKNHG